MRTDRPSDEQTTRRRLTVAAVCGCALVSVALLPIAARPGPEIAGLVPFFVAGVLVTELATSYLLLDLFAEARRWPLLVLGCAYLYSGLMAIAHLLTFPGAVVASGSILGAPEQSAAWIFILWLTGYALLAVTAVGLEAFDGHAPVAPEKVRQSIGLSCVAVAIAAIAITVVATMVPEALPALMRDSRWSPLNLALNFAVVSLLAAGIIAILSKLRQREELYSWLALALTATAAANVLSGAGGGRHTLGWELGRLSWVISACLLFFYFLRQFARQQTLLSHANEMLERSVAERTAELQTSNADLQRLVAERSLLLREVYHRVKNNLQLVDSLLGFQSARMQDAVGKTGLDDIRRRVNALGLVHHQLMQSADLARVDMRAFLSELCTNLGSAAGISERAIRITLSETDPLPSSLDMAVPLGLLTTELVSHALKHGFTNGGTISIALRRVSPDAVVLTVADTGAVEPDQRARAASDIETRLVTGLVAQLRGELTTECNGGAKVTLRFPYPEALL
jgi:two-component sensor histidine kinase